MQRASIAVDPPVDCF
jgi:hypothetical protein